MGHRKKFGLPDALVILALAWFLFQVSTVLLAGWNGNAQALVSFLAAAVIYGQVGEKVLNYIGA